MTRSLMTGISGLRTHQSKLDVIANNLANMNTTGFKSQAMTFSDQMYQNLRNGGGETAPQSVGTGVQISRISRRFNQGPLETTGQIFDFAMQGEGFFTVVSPTGENLYTRDGSFNLDPQGRLIDPSTGYYVRRFGDEGAEDGAAFQISGDDSIRIPLGAAVAGQETTAVDFQGNLPSTAQPPLTQIVSSTAPFETGSGAATLTTLLNDLTLNTVDYVSGDQVTVFGANPDGSTFNANFNADGATMADLVNTLNTAMTGATASLAADGTLTVTADSAGDSLISIGIADSAGNTGQTNFSGNGMTETSPGSDGETYETSFEVFDVRGQTHRVNFEFRKISANSWDGTASIQASSGVLLDDSVFNITFNEDGTFALAGDSGIGDTDIELNLSSVSAPQSIILDFRNMSHLATEYTVNQSPDGFPSGTIVSVSVSDSGQLSGVATNGRTIPLAQLAIARFQNAGALNAIGNNQFQQTIAAGIPLVGEGNTNGRGSIVGGQLESSNVDVAQEFTQLIVAQRGFSANARTITVADEMLEELTNIIR
ncbi:MAG: flagellar hook-basal body complex protein [Planctomycetota bacterium]|nr:flagellar hook-basal body complex protein [Planctomycetota bacterium]